MTNKKTWKLKSKYNLDKMEVGEDKFLPYDSQRISSAACMFGKRNDMKFEVAKEGIGTRVYRTR